MRGAYNTTSRIQILLGEAKYMERQHCKTQAVNHLSRSLNCADQSEYTCIQVIPIFKAIVKEKLKYSLKIACGGKK